MNIILMQIPVLQRIRKRNKEGKVEETTRVVFELISPKYIVRISPNDLGVIIWLSEGAPYVECTLSYDQFIKELERVSNSEKNNEDVKG